MLSNFTGNVTRLAFILIQRISTISMFLLILLLSSCGHSRSKKFDSTKWENDIDDRYEMVENIIASQQLIGLHKTKVIELLGTDTEEGPCENCIGYSTNNPTQGFSIDHEVLEIDFDDQDRVTSVRINDW
jgi:hypothetical protein